MSRFQAVERNLSWIFRGDLLQILGKIIATLGAAGAFLAALGFLPFLVLLYTVAITFHVAWAALVGGDR